MTNDTLTDQLAQLTDPIPTLETGMVGVQGDVILFPSPGASWGRQIPPGGVIVVAGQHDHIIIGDAAYIPADGEGTPSDLTIGWVSTGTTGAHLLHVGRDGRLSGEHGAIALAPGGQWEIRGQRETSREGAWRRVAD